MTGAVTRKEGMLMAITSLFTGLMGTMATEKEFIIHRQGLFMPRLHRRASASFSRLSFFIPEWLAALATARSSGRFKPGCRRECRSLRAPGRAGIV